MPFANGDSFRLCTEGLQALERFERRNSKVDLEIAESRLEECVHRYPNDVVPKFYLGSVKTLRSYEGLTDAVRLLTEVIDSGHERLKEPAQYNLAVAYIERYDAEGFQQAEDLLSALTSGDQHDKSVAAMLKWSARVDLLYIEGHRLWSLRHSAPTPILLKRITDLKTKLMKIQKEFQQSELRNDPEILANYWNVVATVHETEANWRPEQRAALAHSAATEYLRSLEFKRDWIDAKSNLARLYHELLNDNEEARRLWNEVLRVRPDGQYAHFNLGLIARQEGMRDEAREHFRKAPKIPEAKVALKEMDEDASVTPEEGD